MELSTSIKINSTKENIWRIITDIENSKNVISGIQNIQILQAADDDFIGLKWKETRVMFGKEADEVMWITHSQKNSYYKTRAESHGAIYITELRITEESDHCILSMTFGGESVNVIGKIMSALMSGMMKKSMLKALNEDLSDIKKEAEK